MNLHERFQAFCRWCHAVLERDTADDAIRAAEAHEACCKRAPGRK
jgi:hypothetical protein